MRTHKIAVIRGDGIGPEVIEASLAVLDAAESAFGFSTERTEGPWQPGPSTICALQNCGPRSCRGGCGVRTRSSLAQWETRRCHREFWSVASSSEMRRTFQQAVNLRPVKLWRRCQDAHLRAYTRAMRHDYCAGKYRRRLCGSGLNRACWHALRRGRAGIGQHPRGGGASGGLFFPACPKETREAELSATRPTSWSRPEGSGRTRSTTSVSGTPTSNWTTCTLMPCASTSRSRPSALTWWSRTICLVTSSRT